MRLLCVPVFMADDHSFVDEVHLGLDFCHVIFKIVQDLLVFTKPYTISAMV